MVNQAETLRQVLTNYHQALPKYETITADNTIPRAIDNLEFLLKTLPENVPGLSTYLKETETEISFDPSRNPHLLYPTGSYYFLYTGDEVYLMDKRDAQRKEPIRAERLADMLKDITLLGATIGFSRYLKAELVGKIISSI